MGMNGQLHIFIYLQEKKRWYPLKRRLGGAQSQYGCGGDKKDSCLDWESNSSYPAYCKSLYWFSYPCYIVF
jgi:hypothetical protein